MAQTLIQTLTVGAGGATSLEFTGLANTFTDLRLIISARSSASAAYDPILLRFNGSTSGYTGRVLEASVGSYTTSETVATAVSAAAGGTWGRVTATGVPTASHTANTFGSAEIYVTNYAGATNKSFSCDQVGENNGTQSTLELTSNLWSSTAAITSVSIALKDGSFVQGTTASLYGVTKKTYPAAKATGGTITWGMDGYIYHTFTSSGTFTPTTALTADALIVAGGGGSGSAASSGGGGGGGGYRALTAQSLTATGYAVTIGAGGAPGSNGANSTFNGNTATGGGRGAGGSSGPAATGGSGGGGSNASLSGAAGTAGQGYAGGTGNSSWNNGGGGGGAGGAGSNAIASSDNRGAVGGPGIAWLNGSRYAGGGGGTGLQTWGAGGQDGGGSGGAGTPSQVPGTSGSPNTGGGAGGINGYGDSNSGGSGIVIVRYLA